MKTLQKTFNDLATETNLASSFSDSDGQAPKSIVEPIDIGSDKLLESYKNSWLTYPPLDVEYLVQTLNDHLYNCLEYRDKAQDLEVKAFHEASEQLLQRRLLESMEQQMALFAEYEPKLLKNSYKTNFDQESGNVNSSDTAYWKNLLAEQKKQLAINLEAVNTRLTRFNENGGGNNFVERFDFLKELFQKDLIEAYCRGKAACLGLKSIYDIDIPLPEVTRVGYLNKLIIWARTVTYELEKKLFGVRETTVAFVLHDGSTAAAATAAPTHDTPRIFTGDAFRGIRANNGSYIFKIPKDYFERLDLNLVNPRLKGLDIHVLAPDDKQPEKYWRIFVETPEKKIEIGNGFPPYTFQPKVYFPVATYPGKIPDMLSVPNRREVNNVSPIGEWNIRIEPKGVFGNNKPTDNTLLDNLLIRMKIAYERS